MSKRALPPKYFRVSYTYRGPDRSYSYAITTYATDAEDARRIVEAGMRMDGMPMERTEITGAQLIEGSHDEPDIFS